MPANSNSNYVYCVFESLMLPIFDLCDNMARQALAGNLSAEDRAVYQDIHEKLTTYISSARSAASKKGARPALVISGPEGDTSISYILPIGSFFGSTDIQYPLTLFTLPVVTAESKDDIRTPFVVLTPTWVPGRQRTHAWMVAIPLQTASGVPPTKLWRSRAGFHFMTPLNYAFLERASSGMILAFLRKCQNTSQADRVQFLRTVVTQLHEQWQLKVGLQ